MPHLLLFNGSVQGTNTSNMPVLYLEWSPTTNPGAAPSWERIPLADIRSIDINRGRNRELDQFQAGRMTVVLDNRDRHYDPEYSAGPNFGNVKPMRRIRLRAVWDTTYDLFTGFVDSWDQDYDMTAEATCTVTATDGSKVWERADLPGVYAEEVRQDNPTTWFRLNEAATSTTLVDAAGSQITVTEFGTGATLGATGLLFGDTDTALSQTDTTSGFSGNGPFVTVTSSGALTLEAVFSTTTTTESTICSVGDGGEGMRFRLYISAAGIPGFIVGRTLNGNTQTTNVDSGATTANDGEPHHVVGVYDNGTMYFYLDGVQFGPGLPAVTTIGNGQEFCVGNIAHGFVSPAAHAQGLVGTVDEVALYMTALSDTRIDAHAAAVLAPWNGDTTGARIVRLADAIGWSAADRNIDTGESTLQSANLNATALAHAQLVRNTEFGEFFFLPNGSVRFISRHNKWLPPYNDPLFVLSDDNADLGYGRLKFNYDDQLIRNRVTVSYENGVSFTANSTSSQEDFLIQGYSQTGLIGDVDSEAVDYANYVLGRYDEPLLRVQGVSITPQADPDTMFPAVLSADLVYQVNVERTPQDVGTAIDIDYTIEGVAHHIEPKFWRTELQLSPADTPGAFILDSTSQGILDTNTLGF